MAETVLCSIVNQLVGRFVVCTWSGLVKSDLDVETINMFEIKIFPLDGEMTMDLNILRTME